MGSMEVPGERAAEHPQGVRRRRKRQSRQRRTQGGGPYGMFHQGSIRRGAFYRGNSTTRKGRTNCPPLRVFYR